LHCNEQLVMAHVPSDSRFPRSRAGAWVAGIAAALAMGITLVLSLGIAAIFWVPLLFMAGIAMLSVWTARRRRQISEHRNESDVKDPLHVERHWPTDRVVDDRLPER
jgi:hypothetical protein